MTPLGQLAWTHVQALAHGLGPRPAGSDGERQALEYVETRLQEWNYRPARQAVPFAPLPRLFPLPVLTALFLIGACWDLARWPVWGLATPIVLLALPELARVGIARRSRTAQSQNVIAYTPQPAPQTLILCAHVDSARGAVFTRPLWRWLHYHTLFVALRVAIAAAALGALALGGLALPPALIVGLRWAGLIWGIWWIGSDLANQLAPGLRAVPGAHDNASGVGVVLALAEELTRQAPPAGVRIGFLFTGAEETGLHGAEAFAAALEGAEAHATAVINVDMVGAGDRLCLVRGEGTFRLRRTDSGLNAALHQASPEIREVWYTLRGGDYAPFLKHGIRATALQTSGSLRAEIAYHTHADTLAVIDPDALDQTAQTILRLIRAGGWAETPGSAAGHHAD